MFGDDQSWTVSNNLLFLFVLFFGGFVSFLLFSSLSLVKHLETFAETYSTGSVSAF